MDGSLVTLAKLLIDLATPVVGTILAAAVSGWADRRRAARGGHMV